MSASASTVWAVVGSRGDTVEVSLRDEDEIERVVLARAELPQWVAEREESIRPRWVWSDTAHWYPEILAAGIRVQRCLDLRLCHAILRGSALVPDTDPHAQQLRTPSGWDAAVDPETPRVDALFDLDDTARGISHGIDDALAEFARQRAVLDAVDGRLRLLTVAESAGALIAAELRAAGLPWHVPTHEAILDAELGPRDATGTPRRITELGAQVRELLGDPALSLDSQPKLLRGLHRAGILVESTSKWELAEVDHPAIAPLLEYRRITRLQSANGRAWLAEWVHESRFRPIYIPGGVVTGRWASAGGGALQLPRQLRPVVRPDPGWVLVLADVSQLEPRVLAALSGDRAMADAARGRDLYTGLVEAGIVATRQEAKIAVLGAMYGSTTGEAGRLVPRLRRAFPRAMALVDDAARTGEDGGRVSTLLGRTSPEPGDEWVGVQRRASDADARSSDEERARRWAKDRGRFTRNFVVQGTAAEWALVWLAEIRTRLETLPDSQPDEVAPASGPIFARRAHLAFFLHDEVMLHVPASLADAAAQIVSDAADAAARLLFGDFPLDFRLDLRIGEDASK
ncbi:bifunctional 3'-5' exonuclease/DNA polymerase [Microbacterium sp. ZW T5_56]|uniref:bifunctional 3'-5' exonuclease/DNA polymerase n=1 Tax=Microbacterium sp. ZW T5_56 TaxID=3378081 RepID=UPI003852CB5A